jgi:hypothetical protein
MHSYQNLFSTLAQITATILSLLFAFITAYYVFLQDRATQFEDKIEQEKLEIRDSLLQLRSSWPWTLDSLVPPEFKDRYRSKYPNKSEIDLVMQAAIDLIFDNKEMQDALSEVKDKDSFSGSLKGRVYLLCLTRAVTVITVGTPDTRTKPEGVFPSSPGGVGFDEWRADFEKLKPTVELLTFSREEMESDFTKFVSHQSDPQIWNRYSMLYREAVDHFFKGVQIVKSHLIEIDKQKLLKKRYSFSERVHTRLLLGLCAFSFMCGVVLPLLLLGLPELEMTSITAIVITLVAVIFPLGAVVQFGRDVTKPVETDRMDYIISRWYSPLVMEIDRQQGTFENGGLLDLEYFINARNSVDKTWFGKDVTEAIDLFIQKAEKYNEAAFALNKKVIEAIRQDKILGPIVHKYRGNKGGLILYPATFLQTQKISEFLNNFDYNSSDISIEVLMPRWSRVEMKIPGSEFASRSAELKKILESISIQVLQFNEAKSFIEAKKSMHHSMSNLKQIIKATFP